MTLLLFFLGRANYGLSGHIASAKVQQPASVSQRPVAPSVRVAAAESDQNKDSDPSGAVPGSFPAKIQTQGGEGQAAGVILGKVEADERRVMSVSAGLDGTVRTSYDAGVGSHVLRGQKLASFIAPDLVAYADSYLVALQRAHVSVSEAASGISFAAERLRSLGVSEAQMEVMRQTRAIPSAVDVFSPTDGIILARNVETGRQLSKGAELYRIANLDKVWVAAGLPAGVARNLSTRSALVVRAPGTGRMHRARRSGTPAVAKWGSTLVGVRFDTENGDHALAPGMTVAVNVVGDRLAGKALR